LLLVSSGNQAPDSCDNFEDNIGSQLDFDGPGEIYIDIHYTNNSYLNFGLYFRHQSFACVMVVELYTKFSDGHFDEDA
jgi:hypothetical protein